MPVFDGYTRDELRQAYADAWHKHRAGTVLSPLEALIVDVIGGHPEYQPFVGTAQAAIEHQGAASDSAENPFLHMGLHLAVREQLSIDRPPGIRALHRRLQLQFGDSHMAEHALMEALGETLWQAQRAGQTPDEAQYLRLAGRRLTQM